MTAQATIKLAQDLYNMDPNWTFTSENVQKFIAWEKLSSTAMQSYIDAAEGLMRFANVFERDIPLTSFNDILKRVSPNRVTIDAEG